MRIFRLVLGGMIIGESLHSGDRLLMVLGSVVFLQGVFNLGCGFGGSCAISSQKNTNENESISYEEVGKN
jgi:hypothetical protein